MLPPGHFAAGYLASLAVLHIAGIPVQGNEPLVLWGIFVAVAPDLDMFFSFAKIRSFTIDNARANHRKYLSHRPLVWFALSVPLILDGPSESWRLAGILLLVGSWSHFLLDSLQYGVMWLWPFSHRLIALRDTGKNLPIADHRFFQFWKAFLTSYIREFRLTAIAEVCVIIFASCIFIVQMLVG